MATGAGGTRLRSAVMVLLVVSGCSSSDDDDAAEQASAATVAATQAAGVAPWLTVGVAESLYGTDAPGVCDVFDDGLSTAEQNDLLGNRATGVARRSPMTPSPTAGSWSRRTVPTASTSTTTPSMTSIRSRRATEERHRWGGAGERQDGRLREGRPRVDRYDGVAGAGDADGGERGQHRPALGLGQLRARCGDRVPAPRPAVPPAGGPRVGGTGDLNRGGIFVWVKDAFGDRTGFQATWFVFMNSVTLYPSLLSFGAAALATASAVRISRPTAPTWAPSSWWCSGWRRGSSAGA